MTTAAHQSEAERSFAHQRLSERRVEVRVCRHVQQKPEQAPQHQVSTARHPEEDNTPSSGRGPAAAGHAPLAPLLTEARLL